MCEIYTVYQVVTNTLVKNNLDKGCTIIYNNIHLHPLRSLSTIIEEIY